LWIMNGQSSSWPTLRGGAAAFQIMAAEVGACTHWSAVSPAE
jgi:hypothetical protein